MRIPFRLHSLILISLFGCIERDLQPSNALFNVMSPERTGIRFVNKIAEDDSLNVLNYEYMYNGGGVGILDLNNDGLQDIFFTGNQSPNALYLNQGDFHFKDISTSAGIELPNTWCTGVSVVDINSDGYDDLYVCVGGPGNESIFPNKLFINQGNLTFKEMASEYGLADSGESNQAAFFDYDKDGDLDMYLLTGGGLERSAIIVKPILVNGESRNTDRLYQNNYDSIKGHPVFANVSLQAGITIEGYGLGVSIIDANQDTWPDVYVSNDYLSRDLLYISNRDGTFTDQSLEYFKHTSHFSMGNDVGDVNNDGLMDIITLDMLPNNHIRKKLMFDPNQYDRFYQAVRYDYGYQYMRNNLHLNHGKNGFSEIGQLAGINKTDWSWSPLLADFDNDGFLDLYITNGFGKDITDLDFVNFRREAFSPFADQMKMRNTFLDSTNQRPPIKLSNYIFKNEGDLTFSDLSNDWGIKKPSISNGAAFADLDRDGDLEIIVNNINQEPYIFKNNSIEKNRANSHYINVLLAGSGHNPNGLEARVSIFYNGRSQHHYHHVARGFESSVEKIIHFGLGSDSIADSLIAVWPDGKRNLILNPKVNSILEVHYRDVIRKTGGEKAGNSYFTSIESINYTHHEIDYNDFRIQPSLISGLSNQGPAIAVSDVDNNGLDDVFIGGAYGSSGELFIQKPNGNFEKRTLESKDYEDLGAVFFDVDNDGDTDLYLASGGSERYAGHAKYQDRIYFNDGRGNFQLRENTLPDMKSSTSSVCAGDFDQDGDLDLFVGGRVSPTGYPESPLSYLLENQNGKFSDVTETVCPSLRKIGMVTSAVWTDFNNDNKPDLILVGEFMRITLLKNEDKELVDITDETELANSYGMWNSIFPVDIDNDGDMDYVTGNLGLNTPFNATVDHPFKVYFADFDKNGIVDPIFSVFEGEAEYPFSSFDQLKAQIPILSKYIPSYGAFANMTTDEILQLFKHTHYTTLSCTTLTSSVIENLGENHFKISSLPTTAQFAPVNGIAAEDINLDGQSDLILIGNNYSPEVVNGRYDASIGTVLINKGKMDFQSMPPARSGFFVDGDGKALVRMELTGNKSALLASRNNEPVRSHLIESYNNLKRLFLKSDEVSVMLFLADGKRQKVEFPYGGSYLSQSSRSIVITPQITKVEFFDMRGQSTRQIDVNSLIANVKTR